MNISKLEDILETSPVIAAVSSDMFDKALSSPAEIIFYLDANILTVKDKIDLAHKNKKLIFIHMDLAKGLACDKTGAQFIKLAGADGIITTKSQLIRIAGELGLFTIQRFFAFDTKGISGIPDIIASSKPTMVEIMPGIATKVIKTLSDKTIPFIAGGLISTKAEVTEALGNGAFAVSTGKEDLWFI